MGIETEQRSARLGGRRRVRQVAAERPDVPGGRRADDRRGVGDGRPAFADGRMSGEVGVARRRADPEAIRRLGDPAQLRDPVERDQVLRQRPLALPGPDDEIGPAGDRSVSGSRGRQGVGQRRRGGEPTAHVRPRRSSSPWRSRLARASSASSLTRVPIARAMAFAIAPGVGTHGGSAMPLRPLGPPVGDGASTKSTWMAGCRPRSGACSRGGTGCAAGRRR